MHPILISPSELTMTFLGTMDEVYERVASWIDRAAHQTTRANLPIVLWLDKKKRC